MMISAISPKGKLRFMVTDDGLKAEGFIEFCRRLLADTPGKVFLIVDNNRIQHAKIVKEFLASTHGRLELFFLPPYSPELKPDEWVWRNVKNDRIGRQAARSQDELKLFAIGALTPGDCCPTHPMAGPRSTSTPTYANPTPSSTTPT
jgi:transposase